MLLLVGIFINHGCCEENLNYFKNEGFEIQVIILIINEYFK